jgi:hypothetical protein
MSFCWPARLPATPTPSHSVAPHAIHATTITHVVHSGGGGAIADWNLAAGWVTAGATVGLLIGAGFTVKYAVKASQKQGEAIALSQQDVTLSREQADRDIQERHRAQAAQVFIVISMPEGENVPDGEGGVDRVVRVTATATNSSSRPVYDIAVQWHTANGPFGDAAMEPQLLPGQAERFPQRWTAEQGISGLAVSIAFRDAAGAQWHTNDRGDLTELCGHLGPLKQRCTYAPGHGGLHSWEEAPPPQAGIPPRIPQVPPGA